MEGIIADAGELSPGDRVVYPNQGVCRVSGIEQKEIAGQALELVRMTREEDGATVMVPKGKVPTIGLRKVATADQIEGVIHYLAASYDDPELDWKIRHRDNADRLIAGGVLGVAEVVKGLHSLSRIRPLPTKEREQYDNARHLLVHEVAVSLGVPPAMAEDYIDYALMPPAGVTFKLKPPPKPVVLPTYPSYRPKRTAPAAQEEDELGLDELGLDLGSVLGEEAQGAEKAGEALGEVEETEEHAEGAEAEAGAEPAEELPAAAGEGEEMAEEAEPAEPAEAEAEPEEAEEQHEVRRPAAKAKGAAKKKAPAKKPAAKKPAAKRAAPKKEKAKAPKGGKKK